ncbi:MAG: cysteine hydrolase family protein [Saccharofermentanales bacterium]|jgi:nicotinamidase/pyrazinamidase
MDSEQQNILIVVDMQNDFVDGALGTEEAQAIVPYVAEKIRQFEGPVLFTQDTHEKNYLETTEGRHLPVEHCIRGTDGWKVISALEPFIEEAPIEKETFGSRDLIDRLLAMNDATPIASVTLIGLCTDICVISNALMIKAYLPEIDIIVDARGCAGVTPESHRTALDAMKMCHIEIEGEGSPEDLS